MKKYVSVFMLYNRMVFWRVMLALVGMGILEVLLLAPACQGMGNYCFAVGESGIEKVFLLFIVIITAILCISGRGQVYTMWRLRISEWGLFWCRALVSLLYYFLFWAWQVGICYGMGRYFMQVREIDSPQSTVIAFYADDFLHHLFPMEAYHIWAWDFVLLLGLMIVSAAFFFYWQRGKFYYPVICFFLLALLLWDCEGIPGISAGIAGMLILYVVTLCLVWKRSDVRED